METTDTTAQEPERPESEKELVPGLYTDWTFTVEAETVSGKHFLSMTESQAVVLMAALMNVFSRAQFDERFTYDCG